MIVARLPSLEFNGEFNGRRFERWLIFSLVSYAGPLHHEDPSDPIAAGLECMQEYREVC